MTTRTTARQRISVDELRQGRRNLLARRQAVLAAGGQDAQAEASRLWDAARVVEDQIYRLAY